MTAIDLSNANRDRHDNQPETAGYGQKVTGVDQDRYIPTQGPA